MNIEDLMKVVSNKDEYSWSLYFFKKDRRNKEQPFSAYKKRYRDSSELNNYVNGVVTCVSNFQLGKLESIESYNGMNANIVCDFIPLQNDLINKEWCNFVQCIKDASGNRFDGKINGYAICGEPTNDTLKPITFIKFSSPVIELKNNKCITYKDSPEEELDMLSDNFFRLYWGVDAFVYDENFYTFNNSFETIFDIEKSVQKVKNEVVEKIVNTNIIENPEDFIAFSKSYKSPKAFISFDEERLDRVKNLQERQAVANDYGLQLSADNKFIVNENIDFKNFLDFICLKSVCESGTKNIYRMNSATKQKDD